MFVSVAKFRLGLTVCSIRSAAITSAAGRTVCREDTRQQVDKKVMLPVARFRFNTTAPPEVISAEQKNTQNIERRNKEPALGPLGTRVAREWYESDRVGGRAMKNTRAWGSTSIHGSTKHAWGVPSMHRRRSAGGRWGPQPGPTPTPRHPIPPHSGHTSTPFCTQHSFFPGSTGGERERERIKSCRRHCTSTPATLQV